MVDLYFKLVIAGKRTIAQVPTQFRAEVQAKLDAQ